MARGGAFGGQELGLRAMGGGALRCACPAVCVPCGVRALPWGVRALPCDVHALPWDVRALPCTCQPCTEPDGYTKGQRHLPDRAWVQDSKDGQSRSVYFLSSITEKLERLLTWSPDTTVRLRMPKI